MVSPEWRPWEASRLHWWPEDHLDLVLTTAKKRKIRTVEELDTVMKILWSKGNSRGKPYFLVLPQNTPPGDM
jgi:hypothetical protein